eukprot:4807913-Pleurochrysis_carterae.AAC.2
MEEERSRVASAETHAKREGSGGWRKGYETNRIRRRARQTGNAGMACESRPGCFGSAIWIKAATIAAISMHNSGNFTMAAFGLDCPNRYTLRRRARHALAEAARVVVAHGLGVAERLSDGLRHHHLHRALDEGGVGVRGVAGGVRRVE